MKHIDKGVRREITNKKAEFSDAAREYAVQSFMGDRDACERLEALMRSIFKDLGALVASGKALQRFLFWQRFKLWFILGDASPIDCIQKMQMEIIRKNVQNVA